MRPPHERTKAPACFFLMTDVGLCPLLLFYASNGAGFADPIVDTGAAFLAEPLHSHSSYGQGQ